MLQQISLLFRRIRPRRLIPSLLATLHFLLLGWVYTAHAAPEVSGFINAVGGYATERPTLGYEQGNTLFDRDSLLGLQVSGRLSDKISATGQLLAQGKSDYEVEATWAYLTYEFSPSAQMRMGRFRTPLFFYSDFLHVGYAQHWISPPTEVYSLPFDSVNGLDLSYGFSMGHTDARLQIYFGANDGDYSEDETNPPLKIRLREHMGIVGSLQRDWLNLRVSFHQVTRLTIENFADQPLPQPLGSVGELVSAITTLGDIYGFGAGADFVAKQLAMRDISAEFSEAALRLQWQHFFAVAEGTLLTFDDSPLAKQRRHLLSLGTQFGQTTLYATYARANDEPAQLAAAVPRIAGVTEGVRAALNGLTESLALESETASIGLRYELAAGTAFKLEISENTIPHRNQSNLVRFGFHLVF